jgi:hypothetical protein
MDALLGGIPYPFIGTMDLLLKLGVWPATSPT